VKATLQGKIKRILRHDDPLNLAQAMSHTDLGMAEIELTLKGDVDIASSAIVSPKKATMMATLKLHPSVADTLKFGSTITVTVTDE